MTLRVPSCQNAKTDSATHEINIVTRHPSASDARAARSIPPVESSATAAQTQTPPVVEEKNVSESVSSTSLESTATAPLPTPRAVATVENSGTNAEASSSPSAAKPEEKEHPSSPSAAKALEKERPLKTDTSTSPELPKEDEAATVGVRKGGDLEVEGKEAVDDLEVDVMTIAAQEEAKWQAQKAKKRGDVPALSAAKRVVHKPAAVALASLGANNELQDEWREHDPLASKKPIPRLGAVNPLCAGPTSRSLAGDWARGGKHEKGGANFGFTRIHARRRPIVGAHLDAAGCGGARSAIAEELARVFPVHSMGQCQNNYPGGPYGVAPNNYPGGSFGEAPVEDDGSPEAQEALSKYMFFFAAAPADCEGNAPSALWNILSRGSIPVYFGSDEVYDVLPSKDAIVDVKKFESAAALAAYLRQVANDPREFERLREWRRRDPSTWNPGFLKLIRARAEDCVADQSSSTTACPEPSMLATWRAASRDARQKEFKALMAKNGPDAAAAAAVVARENGASDLRPADELFTMACNDVDDKRCFDLDLKPHDHDDFPDVAAAAGADVSGAIVKADGSFAEVTDVTGADTAGAIAEEASDAAIADSEGSSTPLNITEQMVSESGDAPINMTAEALKAELSDVALEYEDDGQLGGPDVTYDEAITELAAPRVHRNESVYSTAPDDSFEAAIAARQRAQVASAGSAIIDSFDAQPEESDAMEKALDGIAASMFTTAMQEQRRKERLAKDGPMAQMTADRRVAAADERAASAAQGVAALEITRAQNKAQAVKNMFSDLKNPQPVVAPVGEFSKAAAAKPEVKPEAVIEPTPDATDFMMAQVMGISKIDAKEAGKPDPLVAD